MITCTDLTRWKVTKMHFRVRQQQWCCPYPQGSGKGPGIPHTSLSCTLCWAWRDPAPKLLVWPIQGTPGSSCAHKKVPELCHSTHQHSQLCSGCNSPSCPIPRDSVSAGSSVLCWQPELLDLITNPANTGAAAQGESLYPNISGASGWGSLQALPAQPSQHSLVLSEGAQTATANPQRGARANPHQPWNCSPQLHISPAEHIFTYCIQQMQPDLQSLQKCSPGRELNLLPLDQGSPVCHPQLSTGLLKDLPKPCHCPRAVTTEKFILTLDLHLMFPPWLTVTV